MSHIVDLARIASFEAAERRNRSSNSLRKQALIGGAGIALAAVLGLGFAAWHASAKTAPLPPPPVPVLVEVAHAGAIRLWTEFSGRLTAVDSAEIRPQVDGRITEIHFKDGQQVHAGDVLFVIDPRPYAAAVAKAEADLATAQHNASLARVEVDRASNLLRQQAIARDLYDQRVTTNEVDQAAIKSAEAALAQAKVNLDFAYVKAPISGRVARAEITVGNLVQSQPTPPLLTTIVSSDGIYADFDVDEQTYLANVRAHATTAAQEQKIPVELTVQGDNGHVYKGAIESFDNKISTGTGTIRARARFANEDGSLMPGMFVSVKLASAADSKAILVPEEAIGRDQSKRFVYVVGPDHRIGFREVALGEEVAGERVVTSGLHDGDRIVVDGLQKVQPGAVVSERLADASSPRMFAAR